MVLLNRFNGSQSVDEKFFKNEDTKNPQKLFSTMALNINHLAVRAFLEPVQGFSTSIQ